MSTLTTSLAFAAQPPRRRAERGTHGARESEAELARLHRRLVKVVHRICPPWLANDRDDVVQNAMLRLLRTAERTGGGLDYSNAYLRRAAYTHVVDEIRRWRRRRELALEDCTESQTLHSGQPSPETSLAGRELGEEIRHCLATLVAPRRTAVSLWLLGYGNPEIARLLGWTPKRAENLVSRGRENLRTCLAAKGYRPDPEAANPFE